MDCRAPPEAALFPPTQSEPIEEFTDYRLLPRITVSPDFSEIGHFGRQRDGYITRVEEALMRGMDLSSEEVISLRESLSLMKVKDIKSIAKNLSIRVTAATKKIAY